LTEKIPLTLRPTANLTGGFSILLCHTQLPHATSSDSKYTYMMLTTIYFYTSHVCSVQLASARRTQIKSGSRIFSTYVKWFTQLADWSYFLFRFSSLVFTEFFRPLSFNEENISNARNLPTPRRLSSYILLYRYYIIIYLLYI